MRGRISVANLLAALIIAWVVPSPVGGQALTKVRVSTVGITADHAFYVGVEKGYFREQGIDLELIPFAGAGDAMAPLTAGQIDVTGGGINVALFNGLARGMPIKIVAMRAYSVPGNDANLFMIRTDLVDQIKTPADLKGRKFAINAPASPLVYMLGRALEQAGLTRKDVEVVTMPFPAMITAFQTKAIDAAIEVEPFAARAEAMGVARIWRESVSFVPMGGMQVGVVFYNSDWAAKNPDLARRFMVAFLKGAREYYDLLMGGPRREETIQTFIKYTALKDRSTYDKIRMSFMDPNGRVAEASIQDQLEWYVAQGMVTHRVDLKQYIDHSYVDYAAGVLGRMPCPRCPR